jgi:hypothetical protein
VKYATIRRFQDAPSRREESIHGWGLIRMDKSRAFGPCTFSAALDHAFMCTLRARQLIGEQLFAECESLLPKMLSHKLSCAFQHRYGYSLPDIPATQRSRVLFISEVICAMSDTRQCILPPWYTIKCLGVRPDSIDPIVPYSVVDVQS